MIKSKILPIWQPVGYSTHIIAKKVSEKFGVKTAHTGTLDPMAEGVIIVLYDDKRHMKFKYSNWMKTYEFEIALGITTDTFDGLGLIKKDLPVKKISKDKLEDVLRSFIGDYEQIVPAYSAQKIKGKPLHWYARKYVDVKLPEKRGRIFKIKLDSLYEKNLTEVINNILFRIELVSGNFRQEKIKKCWQNFNKKASGNDVTLQIAKIRVETSKGIYIRSLSQDISKKLGVHSFVYTLVRTKNGSYSRENSLTLEEIFGSNFRDKYNFESRA